MKNLRTRKLISTVALNGLIAVLAILWLVPVFWLIISSFRAEQGAYTSYLWPKGFTFDNYIRLFTDRKLFDFPRWFGNTLFVAGCSCVITTILTLMVAYWSKYFPLCWMTTFRYFHEALGFPALSNILQWRTQSCPT